MRPRYDFSDAKPNPYWRRYAEGTNVILLERDVAEFFKDSEAVNKALRGLIEASRSIRKRPSKARRRRPAKARA
jgi:hypothetical protein